VLVGALVLAMLVRTFLFQAFYIPSPSMEPTLWSGDRILVNKLSYQLHDVNRGDLVVFRSPPDSGVGGEDLIKRVIALPGERVTSEGGRLLIGGGLLIEPYLPFQNGTADFGMVPWCSEPEMGACTVPDGHVFVMGDNRSNSRDSRFFGPVPVESIVGRAFVRVWPLGALDRL
jgi:signal peptidase I